VVDHLAQGIDDPKKSRSSASNSFLSPDPLAGGAVILCIRLYPTETPEKGQGSSPSLLDASQLASLLPNIVGICREAGSEILNAREIVEHLKTDGSPVTKADLLADRLIRSRLGELSDDPVISEECDSPEVDLSRRFWIVDPLDGTKEYLKGSSEFTVNVALIEGGKPILGVVHAPALTVTYYAADGAGAFKQDGVGDGRIASSVEPGAVRVAVSRDHITPADEGFISRLSDAVRIPKGSSLKFCLVADGTVHVYPRLGRTREWDTAAAQCVIEQAGGCVVDLSCRTIRYGKPDLINPGLIAAGNREWIERMLRHD